MPSYKVYFTFRSLTAAEHGARSVRRAGLPVRLVRAPAALSAQGCGYALETASSHAVGAAGALRQAGLRFGGAYRIASNGVPQEVPL